MRSVVLGSGLFLLAIFGNAQEPAKQPPNTKAEPPKTLRIMPGEVRRDQKPIRFRGQLVSVDPKTRTGKFKRDNDGEVVAFHVLPYATLMHRLSLGDLADYREGQRFAFHFYEGPDGKPDHLITLQDELQELHAHKEHYVVKAIDADKGLLTCNRERDEGATLVEGSKLVWENLLLQTTKETRYWKAGQPDAKFTDLKVNTPFHAVSYGGEGLLKRFVADVLLDDVTLLKWQADQAKVLKQRFRDDGMPAYIDAVNGREVSLTIFPEATDTIRVDRVLRAKGNARLAVAGVDRVATGARAAATVADLRLLIDRGSYVSRIKLTLAEDPPASFKPTTLVRIWGEDPPPLKKP